MIGADYGLPYLVFRSFSRVAPIPNHKYSSLNSTTRFSTLIHGALPTNATIKIGVEEYVVFLTTDSLEPAEPNREDPR